MRGVKNLFFAIIFALIFLSNDASSQNLIDSAAVGVMDQIYGDRGTYEPPGSGVVGRSGQWKGNCGRGIFLYEDKLPHNANSIDLSAGRPQKLLPDTARLGTNDIWTSRTGCWNPEERFSFTPPYFDFERVRDSSTVNPNAPESVKNNIVFYEPTGNKNLERIRNSRAGFPNRVPEDGPWDEPYAPDISSPAEWLIPNDRLLMPHPLCTNITEDSVDTFYDPTGKIIDSDYLKNLTEFGNVKRRIKNGSLPRCVAEDYYDDVDNYCQEYLEASDGEFGELPDQSGSRIGKQNTRITEIKTKRYTSRKYVFDFDRFCWTSTDIAGDPIVQKVALAFSPYEHWMPLAIRSTLDPAIDSNNDGVPDDPSYSWGEVNRTDIFGKNHRYRKTDVRRPTFTPYSERTVFDKTVQALSTTEHILYSLEEYGYDERPIMRRDYNYNPQNIYDPNNTTQISASDLLDPANMGRKQKMYKCLKMYIEQWAFEGDKGQIYLRQGDYAGRLGVGNDASMCQWSAYYDVSENLKADRKFFKEIMTHFFEKNPDGDGIDFVYKDKILGSIVSDLPTKDIEDVRRFGCHEYDDTGILSDGLKCSTDRNFKTDTSEKMYSQNTFGIVRKVGMRPEAFDYFNFLTFSAMPTSGSGLQAFPGTGFESKRDGEKVDLTHNVELSGGGIELKKNSLGLYQTYDLKDLYGNVPDNILSDPDNINRVNFGQRECKTAITPQVWHDVIGVNAIAYTCDFTQGARVINSLFYPLQDNLPPPLDSLLGAGLDLVSVTDNWGRKHRHWLTTLVDVPIISLLTTIPQLPVATFGFTYRDGIEAFPFVDSNSTIDYLPIVPIVNEARDNWHRADGETILPYHLAQPITGPRNLYPASPLGWIVVDEVYRDRGRDWVNHSWPASSCMHTWKSKLGGILYKGQYENIKSDPRSIDDKRNMIDTSWRTFDDIRLDYLAGDSYDNSTYRFGLDDMVQAHTDAKANQDVSQRKFGGFKIFKNNSNYYYSWLPTKWSVGIGIQKAFWCEFELPYFPYVVGAKEFERNRAPFNSFFTINGKFPGDFFGILGPKKLEKRKKPRLEYYRVERIRDACGPFGVRSTWINYERDVGTSDEFKFKFFDWLIGDVSTRQTPPDNYMIDSRGTDPDSPMYEEQYYHLKSRCANWVDMYRKRVNNPKAIAWRLARFDYEFMKAFLECTGPYRNENEVPKVCNYNRPAHNDNIVEAVAQTAYAWANYSVGIICTDPLCLTRVKDTIGRLPFTGAQCVAAGLGAIADLFGDVEFAESAECYGQSLRKDLTDTVVRALDYSTRGDTVYKWYKKYEGDSRNSLKDDDGGLAESPGFETPAANSIAINKFWLRRPGESFEPAGNEPYGFWCKCPSERKGNNGTKPSRDPSAQTTRCSEELCTCEQHVLYPSRYTSALSTPNVTYAAALFTWGYMLANADWAKNIDEVLLKVFLPIELMGGFRGIFSGKPMAICADYGPYRRWIHCFYSARASACPVITRDVSDSIPYSTLKDPFVSDKKVKDSIPENTQKSQSFNVCDSGNPIGHGDEEIEGFVRWSLEEPNHLARLPVWFESGGAGYGHEDLVFQSQVRDWQAPYMELSVPFPIDLISRSCEEWGKRKIKLESGSFIEVEACIKEKKTGSYPLVIYQKGENSFGEYPDNLTEIMQREGLGYSQITYINPTNIGGQPPKDEFAITDKRFKTSFLLTRDTSQIVPIVNASCFMENDPANGCDSRAYQQLYLKYAKGLYAAGASFSHATFPEEPGDPTILSDPANPNSVGTDKQNINPRGQDKIVGPRGCDIGGWWEMMLYQARCIRWHNLNCICDYDKTFAKGNAVNYVLKKAGGKFDVVAPTCVGCRYETEIKFNQDGSFPLVMEQAERDARGLAKDRNLGGATSKRTKSKIIATPKVDPDTGRPVLLTKINGRDIDVKDEYLPGVAQSNNPIYFPLKDRGLVGPEFGVTYASGGVDIWADNIGHRRQNLDNVRIGDLVIWDEEIKDLDPSGAGTGIDVGYPRHIAYVKDVERVGDIVIKFTVSEMNWGKLYDSCGNTNRWGIETDRIINRPICSSSATSCPYPVKAKSGGLFGGRIRGTIDKYADCRNSDWYQCVEKYWDQVKIYRPLINDTGNYGDTIADPEYTNTSCDERADFPRRISRGYVNSIADNIFTTSGYTPSDTNLLKGDNGEYDPAKLKRHLEIKYRDGTLSMDKILDDSDLWKLMITPSDYGKFYKDEVDEFLYNPVSGAADNCDPHFSLRDSHQATLNEIREILGLVK